MAIDPSPKKPFDTLQTLLATSTKLLGDLLSDPQLDRVLRAFLILPEEDREVIVQVIEKDATWRRIVEKTRDVSGIRVRPNPHASLYVHVLEQGEVEPDPSARDENVIRLGIERFVELIPLLFQPAVHALWASAAREVAKGSAPDLRALTAQLAREVLAIVAEADSE